MCNSIDVLCSMLESPNVKIYACVIKDVDSEYFEM